MDQFLFLLTRSSQLTRAAADDAMSRHGVRIGQNVILELLWIRDGQTPGELAFALGIATTVVRSARRLQAAGLLTRRPHETDGRLVRLWLTPNGRKLHPIIEQERAHLTNRALAELDGDERAALIRLTSGPRRGAGRRGTRRSRWFRSTPARGSPRPSRSTSTTCGCPPASASCGSTARGSESERSQSTPSCARPLPAGARSAAPTTPLDGWLAGQPSSGCV